MSKKCIKFSPVELLAFCALLASVVFCLGVATGDAAGKIGKSYYENKSLKLIYEQRERGCR